MKLCCHGDGSKWQAQGKVEELQSRVWTPAADLLDLLEESAAPRSKQPTHAGALSKVHVQRADPSGAAATEHADIQKECDHEQHN